MKIRPLIMCGGSGTRLWPQSREAFPKQFAPLIGRHSTFQDTVLRVADPALFGRPLVVTNRQHRFMVERQLAEIGIAADLLLEPVARDSGPAIIAGTVQMSLSVPDQLVLVLASDHVVRDVPAFHAVIASGISAAQAGRIVTFGITPTHPATGYGYIAPGEGLEGAARSVKRFVEKPDAPTAQRHVLDGYLWNSGNFLFSAETMLGEYDRFAPESLAHIRASVTGAVSDLGVPVLDEGHFSQADKKSIDYSVMEKTDRAAVVAGQFGWSDIGGWDALWEISAKDEAGNASNGDVILRDTSNSYASSDSQLVAVIGLENVVVVANRDAVLVADKSRSAEVKGLVDQLKKSGRPEATNHAKCYRPWGWYQTLELAERFQVKRIVVYPGGRLSLQKHVHRSEHWVVVRGTADVTVGEDTRSLHENQSVYIPVGAVHRLENPGRIDVEVIEVQTGSYLGEDDIIRLDDIYNRT